MPRAAALVAGLALSAGVLHAQTGGTQPPYEPTLVFSIGFGLTGKGDLWNVPKQPQPAPAGFDTLDLGRVLRPGVVAGLAATYFSQPKLGLTAEVTYFGIASEQRCRGPLVYQVDSTHVNQQACDRANGEHVNTSVVGFLVGATFRTTVTAKLQPVFRITVGPGLIANSYVQTGGFVITSPNCTQGCRLILLDEASAPQFTWVINASAGLTYYLTPAYRIRFDAHDVITALPVATGPHPPTSSTAPTGTTMRHVPTFTFGLDLSLERRRARRY